MNARTVVILMMALAAGLVSAFLIASLSPPSHRKAQDADYYCYELRQAWVCAYQRPECEARLAREAPSDVQRRCTAHVDVPLTP